jgi:hypothetical protein
MQLCLLLLFAQDVFCFSLGYPFLPGYLADHGHAGTGTALAFGIYGAASIVSLLLLLMVTSSSSSSRGVLQRPSAKFWLIVASTSLSAAAGAANTAAPESYPILLMTKAIQGSASALYFVYTLNLVAAVFPAAYKTQAMAFVSAGLTLGDALGPVVGGVVYQLRGLRQALGMQPLASGVALLALLMLVVAWPSKKRPWSLHKQQQQQQQQHSRQQQKQQQQQHLADVESAAADLKVPLLADQDHAGLPAAVASSTAAAAASTPHKAAAAAAVRGNTPRCTHATAGALSHTSCRSAAAVASKRAAPSLLQLLRSTGVLSLCMLALMCQAARTALDLLLPMLLQDSVQPGIVGALFAGEAVGSVVTPFLVDWLLHKQTGEDHDESQGESKEGEDKQQQQQDGDSDDTAAGDCSREGCSSAVSRGCCQNATDCGTKQQHCCCRHQSTDTRCATADTSSRGCRQSSSSSSSSSTALAANRLLFLSAIGMAISCCLVLTAWQLPALGCSLVESCSSSSSRVLHVPLWVCPQNEAAAAVGNHIAVNTAADTQAAAGIISQGIWQSSRYTTVSEAVPGPNTAVQVKFLLGLTFRGSLVASSLKTSSSSSSGRDRIIYVHEQAAGSVEEVHFGITATAADSTASEAAHAEDAAQERYVDVVYAAAAAADAAGAASGVVFGLLQLLLTGCVLALLGGCHSSCETLIYTVLTDLVEAAAEDVGKGTTCDGVLAVRGCKTCCANAACQVCGSGIAECSTAETDDKHLPCDTSCGHVAGSLHTHVHAGVCSYHRSACCRAISDHYNYHDDTADELHEASDSTEVVMILYVLFWVVGFTVGAAVAGLPGSSVLAQQLTACVVGLVLACSAVWAWRTAAAAFGSV